MINIVEEFLIKFNLNTPKKTFLVGFSGGCDSLCLLDILHGLSKKYGFKLTALHLNHNWRGEESLKEELFCRNFCKEAGIEFISETLESVQKTEKFAREARYNFFLKNAKNYPDSCIFTAHSRTDNAETIIYRIVKGTGIKGIQGIPPVRMLEEFPVYRPLLHISGRRIQDYCKSKGLVPNADSSNLDISYKRNFIRHKIIPLIEEINFHAEKSIVSLAQIAQNETKIIDEYLTLIKKDLICDGKIYTQKFKTLSEEVMKRIIYEGFLKYQLEYNSKKIDDVLDFIKTHIDSKSGSRCSIAENLWLFVNSEYIYLIDKLKDEKNELETDISKEGEYKILGTDFIFSIRKYSNETFTYPAENEKIAYVNLENTGINLKIRTRREGDFITPFGMRGSMKLKKYLNSKKISQHTKDNLILLCNNNEVLWVIGVGLSNKLKVLNKPTHIIKIEEVQ